MPVPLTGPRLVAPHISRLRLTHFRSHAGVDINVDCDAVILTGPNGAGKTTLIKLISRLYDPTKGRILLDGVDIRNYDISELRSEIGIIFQDFVKYHLTAFENIAVGRISKKGDVLKVKKSAK